MAYDVDVADERFAVEDGGRRRVAKNAKVDPRDLETIITMMEIAALSLTKVPGATFTRKELIAEAQRLAGKEIEIQEDDINIVLAKQGFLKRVGKELSLR
jgi:competence protein ComGF